MFLKLLQSYLFMKAKHSKITSYLADYNIIKSDNLAVIDRKNIRVAAVQERISIMKSLSAYVDNMHRLTKSCVDKGAQLVAFPEENGLLPLGMIPFVETILKVSRKNKRNSSKDGDYDLKKLFYYLTPFLKEVFETLFSELSRSFGVYIMPGSIMLYENGKLYNRAYLFGPDGEIIGVQDKLHLLQYEKPLGICVGEELKVFDTQLGRVAFPVCMDATYFETFKILKNMGAEIVIIPIANIEEYNYHLALRGIWPRVQESGLYGIKSALVGDLYGIGFTGRAGIFAPIDIIPNGSGIIRESNSYNEEEIICESIDLTLLQDYYNPYFSDRNQELYKKYFPYVYDNSKSEM